MAITMRDVGEKGFIKSLLPRLRVAPSFFSGFGHDASVVDVGSGSDLLVMKIDRAPVPTASLRGWENYRVWGRIAVTANCSDVLAIGGIPKAMMVCICVPPTWEVGNVADIVLGCEEECLRWGVAFVGGDTKQSSAPEVVGSVAGIMARSAYLPRDGARPGQRVVVAGAFGGFVGAYLQLLATDAESAPSRRGEWIWYLAHPTARWREAAVVREHRGVTAGMDTSDGLYDALSALSGERLGVELDLEAIPFHPFAIECAEKLGVPLFNTAFGVGDWNIIYAVDEDDVADLVGDARKNNAHLAVIGRFNESGGITARNGDGKYFEVRGIVNEHFRARMEDQADFMEQIRTKLTLLPIDTAE